MFYHSHFILEGKSTAIQTLKTQMINNSTDLRNILDIKDLGKSEVENEYRKLLFDNEYAHNVRIREIEDEYNAKIKAKDKEIMKINLGCSQTIRECINEYNDLQEEAVSLFEVARLQGKAIYDIEKGKFNKGISPVLIPRTHIPPVPNDSRFPLIFSALGSQALEVARVSTKKKNQFSYTPNKSTISFNRTTSSSKEIEKTSWIPETNISALLGTSLDTMKIDDIWNTGSSLQKIIKQNSEEISDIFKAKKNKESDIINAKEELEAMFIERNKYKDLYTQEVRKRIDEADKNAERFHENAFLTELLSRPCSQRNIETSSKMMRNIHTTVSGHRLPPDSISPSKKFELLRPSTTAVLPLNGNRRSVNTYR